MSLSAGPSHAASTPSRFACRGETDVPSDVVRRSSGWTPLTSLVATTSVATVIALGENSLVVLRLESLYHLYVICLITKYISY